MPPVVLISFASVSGQWSVVRSGPLTTDKVPRTKTWLGRVDSNQRMPVPKTGALPLGYAPVSIYLLYLRERKKREPR